MKRMLYLQNGPTRDTVSKLEMRFAGAGLAVDFVWMYGGERPEGIAGYDACFISGSPHGAYEDIDWIHAQHDVIGELAGAKVPTLGICFGSQILASALCGRDQVFRRPICEVGYAWLDVTAAARGDEIAADLGPRVNMFVWHNDEVRADHPDMVVLASTLDCPNHVWRFTDLPIWGIQGHPEVDGAQARSWFASERTRERLEIDGADVPALIAAAHDAGEAKSLLANFMILVGCSPEAARAAAANTLQPAQAIA